MPFNNPSELLKMHTNKTTIDTKQLQFEVTANNQIKVSFPSHYEQKEVENALLKCIKGCHLQDRLEISIENGLFLITKMGVINEYFDVLLAHINTNYPEQLLLDFGFASQAIENIKYEAIDCYQAFKDIVFCIRALQSGLYHLDMERNEIISGLCLGIVRKFILANLVLSSSKEPMMIPPTMVHTHAGRNNQAEGNHDKLDIDKLLDLDDVDSAAPVYKSASPQKQRPHSAKNNCLAPIQGNYRLMAPKYLPIAPINRPIVYNKKPASLHRVRPVKKTLDSASINVNVINDILPRDKLNLQNTFQYFNISMAQKKILENIDKNTLKAMGIIKIRKKNKIDEAEVMVNCAAYYSWNSNNSCLPATRQTPSITQPSPLSNFSHFRVSLQTPQPELNSIYTVLSFSGQ